MIMFISLKCPSWLFYSATVVWLLNMVVDMPTLGYCHKTGGAANFTCVEPERRALLEFKHGLEIANENLLSDWSAENMDCCRWEGIKCSKNGQVMALDLGTEVTSKYPRKTEWFSFGGIRGEIGPSLFDLPYLEFIDLSMNEFSGKIPAAIGTLKRLRYLDLSFNFFSGIVPHQLGNLSALESFDLGNNFSGLEVDSLSWISGLSSLKYLDINRIDLSSTSDWLQSITNLPSLTNVNLQSCMVHSPSGLKHVNSTKPLQLQELDLSYNDLEGEIPDSFANLTSLLTLDVSGNKLSNSSGFLQLGSTSLQQLRLGRNKIIGFLPDLLKFPSLRVITVAHNEFKYGLEQFLEQGFRLVELDLSSNSFNGVLREDNFLNLTKLQVLILSFNSVALNFSTRWVPPFQLAVAKLRNSKLGPGFPHWLRGQSNLTHLDISNSGISEATPSWFWNISSRLQYLNISHNSMNNKLPDYLPPRYTILDLSFST